MSTIRIVAAQLNLSGAALKVNTQAIIEAIQVARDQQQADLIVFPELAVCGYLSEDLLLQQDFHHRVQQAVAQICAKTIGIAVVLGYPEQTTAGLFNAASLMVEGQIMAIYHKQFLANQGVFDEYRYFVPGQSPCIFTFKGVCFTLLICEDLWHPMPLQAAVAAGAQCALVLNASPFEPDKAERRQANIQQRAAETLCPILSVNTVGGQDDLVFDGGSLAVDGRGVLKAQAAFMQAQLLTVELEANTWRPQPLLALPSVSARNWQALKLALGDYVRKNHFSEVLLGVSGGIDSALTLVLAVDTLGSAQVRAVLLPSRYTTALSMELAQDLCQRLSVNMQVISIEPGFQALLQSIGLDPHTPPLEKRVENMQARCRGLLLMALSNQTAALLLNTTNKSELAVGYGTLYGDLIGGFAPLKDILKTEVYRLAEYRNQLGPTPLLSEALLRRPPTAELRPEQCDEDSLLPYNLLDAILKRYLEEGKSLTAIVAEGFVASQVRQVIAWVDGSEFKRRQAPIGPRISTKAFGRDRRYPLQLDNP